MSIKEDRRSVTLPVLRATQPIGDFYVGRMDSKTLCEITEFDIRQLVRENEIESYLGIQRRLDPKRVAEIAEYVRTTDACFPTAVILAVPAACALYIPRDEQFGDLTLSNFPDPEEGQDPVLFRDIARVLDGQHRIEGLRGLSDRTFEVNVCVFVGLDIAEQAYIFATVNLAQTKVNKSLVYDLFDLAKLRSPQKVCHNIAVALDGTEKSPLYQRIKRLGIATEGRYGETITQANFVESLMKYISKNPLRDQEIYKRGGTPPKATADELSALIFRNMMIEERDMEIADVIWNYFDAVRQRWPEYWDNLAQGQMLSKANGFRALVKFLRDAYLFVAPKPGAVPKTSDFSEKIFNKVPTPENGFDVREFKPGTSGETTLWRFLKEKSGLTT
jgi:DGQHR domain-containing protein